ncbi:MULTISPECIES: HAD family hydrolase [unclassified Sinorhizobium]|uniref:HAD family hydrolase n=1 Tax=unclassified Sinorhizobium TaxID=2613772 RepID=UPI0035251913
MTVVDLQSYAAVARPKLIIFDFDGTLAETEAMAAEIISNKLAAQGLNLEPDEIARTLSGVPKEKDQPLLEQLLGVRLHESFMDEVRAEWRAGVSAGLAPTNGALETLKWLPIPFCVASNASRADLIQRMRATRLFGLIGSRFFSSDDVGLRKPDPAVFLLAAEAMGVEPHECLVIEDSVAGCEAARRAQMRYCAFVGARHQSTRMRAELEGYEPEALFFDLRELGHFLDLATVSRG